VKFYEKSVANVVGATLTGGLFNARRYVSAVYAVVHCQSVRLSVCSSVCPSQAGVVWKRLDESSWFLAWGFLPPIPHCVIRKFGYLQKLGYFSLELRPQNFITACRSRCQQHSSSSSSSTVEFVDDTYTTVDESWLFTTSRSTVILQLHSICCGFVVKFVSTVDKILTDIARRDSGSR